MSYQELAESVGISKSAAQVALDMGNSPAMVFRHYRKPVTEQDAAMYFGIMPRTPENVIALPASKVAGC